MMNLHSSSCRVLAAATACAGALLAGLAFTPAAGATPGTLTSTATLSGGSLTLINTPAFTFTATLTGANQTTTAVEPIDVGDDTGSGAGWNLTGTSTQFTAGSHTLPISAVTMQAGPTTAGGAIACDSGVTCTPAVLATGTPAVTYPYSLPSAPTTAPTATKFFNAGSGTGMGNQTISPTWTMAIPAGTYAGSYTSTWTITLGSAP